MYEIYRSRGYNMEESLPGYPEVLGVEPEDVWAVRELGFSISSLGRRLGISIPSVSESVLQGKRTAEEKDLHFVET